MRVCCASDLHGCLPEIPNCDLLLLAGDYPRNTRESYWWYRDSLAPWLESHRERGIHTVAVAGNHDVLFEKRPDLIKGLGLQWEYLQDSSTTFRGYKIYGSPWQRRYYDWAFNLDEPELAEKWSRIPDNTDILLLHGPPLGIGDETTHRDGKDGHAPFRIGSQSLLNRIKAIHPKLVVYGHNHGGYGKRRLKSLIDGRETLCVNCAVVDDRYVHCRQPIIVELLDTTAKDSHESLSAEPRRDPGV